MKRPVIRPERVLFPVLVLLILFIGGRWASGLGGGGDPLSRQSCTSCHLAGERVKPGNASLLVAPAEQLCLSCHPSALQASHPSGVRPSMSVPARFPLDWRNKVTCASCHHIHAPAHGLLRVEERGAAFCTGCHEMAFFTRMADLGGSVLISGHMRSGDKLEAAAVDEYSVQCMACHDERGEGPVVGLVDGLAKHGGGGAEHPVGVDYVAAAQMGSYRPVGELPASIQLPGGQVSCISCHQGYSGQHGQMVVSNQGSNLCFQCHDL